MKKYQRIILLILTVAYITMLIPYTDVFAAEKTDLTDLGTPAHSTELSTDDGKYDNLVFNIHGSPVYCIAQPNKHDGYDWSFVSTDSFTLEREWSSNEKEVNLQTFTGGLNYVDDKKTMSFYNYTIGERLACRKNSYATHFNGPYLLYDGNDYKKDVYNLLTTGDADAFDTSNAEVEGSKFNPIKKDSIGYPRLYEYTWLQTYSSQGTEPDLMTESGAYFKWHGKTTTGFDLCNNDYNQTLLECRVQSHMQYSSSFSLGKDGADIHYKKFDNYGEIGQLDDLIASKKSHTYKAQEVFEALPKSSAEMHWGTVKWEYVFYFRVVCRKTTSTVVIPDPRDCTYVAGPWRSVTVSNTNFSSSAEIEDGDLDDDGNWTKDDTSDDNGKDIGNGSVDGDNLDDAAERADDGEGTKNKKENDMDVETAKNTLKDMLEMVRFLPSMFSMLFSFLPTWVHNMVSLTIAAMCILMVYKLLRG